MPGSDLNMKGKICMVTGATSGIGLETARALAYMGATTIIVERSLERTVATVARIQELTGNPNVEYLLADLSIQSQIRQLAKDFKQRHTNLHVLVNNAGAFFVFRKLSADGIEMTWALNHLNYFLLTNLLLDTLQASAPARIVNVASGAHMNKELNFDDLQNRRGYYSERVYGQSKLANILFTYELARRLDGTQVTANALYPGWVATNIGKNNGWLVRLLLPLIQRSAITPEEGAQTSIYLATSPEVEGLTGKYFERCKPIESSPVSYDEETARRLWQISAQMTGLKNL